jgi:hypothetical protein
VGTFYDRIKTAKKKRKEKKSEGKLEKNDEKEKKLKKLKFPKGYFQNRGPGWLEANPKQVRSI